MQLFSSTPVSFLGVDIGSSGIKLVELKKHQDKVVLTNYGYSYKLAAAYPDINRLDIRTTAENIEKITKKSGLTCKSAVSSLPTFTVFSSIIHLSGKLNAKDLGSAIAWEAKKIIPLPLNDIVLDWQKIEGGAATIPAVAAPAPVAAAPDAANAVVVDGQTALIQSAAVKQGDYKILLIGAPKNLIKSYAFIFKSIKYNLVNLETEVFGLIRSLLGPDKSTAMIVQIGASSTNIFIVDQGVPVLSRSIDVGGLAVTKAIAKQLNIPLNKAEQFKYDLAQSGAELPKMIVDVLSPLYNEIKYILESFPQKENSEVNKVVLTGGGALLYGLSDFLTQALSINVVIGDPWFRIAYPLGLKPVLEQIGPRLAVAIGLAMREFDKD